MIQACGVLLSSSERVVKDGTDGAYDVLPQGGPSRAEQRVTQTGKRTYLLMDADPIGAQDFARHGGVRGVDEGRDRLSTGIGNGTRGTCERVSDIPGTPILRTWGSPEAYAVTGGGLRRRRTTCRVVRATMNVDLAVHDSTIGRYRGIGATSRWSIPRHTSISAILRYTQDR